MCCMCVIISGQSNCVDMTCEEETCALSSLVVGVTKAGNLCLVRQEGRGSIDPESLKEMIELGRSTGLNLHEHVDDALRREEKIVNRTIRGFLS